MRGGKNSSDKCVCPTLNYFLTQSLGKPKARRRLFHSWPNMAWSCIRRIWYLMSCLSLDLAYSYVSLCEPRLQTWESRKYEVGMRILFEHDYLKLVLGKLPFSFLFFIIFLKVKMTCHFQNDLGIWEHIEEMLVYRW